MQFRTSVLTALAAIAVIITITPAQIRAQNPPAAGGWRRVDQTPAAPAPEFQQVGDVRFRMAAGWERRQDYPGPEAWLGYQGRAPAMRVFPSRPKGISLRATFESFLAEWGDSEFTITASPQSTFLNAVRDYDRPAGYRVHWIAVEVDTRCVLLSLSGSRELVVAHLKEFTETAAGISLTSEPSRKPEPAAPPVEGTAPRPSPPQPHIQRFGTMEFRIPAGWKRVDQAGNLVLMPASGSDEVGIIIFSKPPAFLPDGPSQLTAWRIERNDPQAAARYEELSGPNGYSIHRMSLQVKNPDGRRVFTVYDGWHAGRRTELLAHFGSTEEVLRRHSAEIEEFRQSVFFEFGAPLSLPAARPGPLEGFFGGKYYFSPSGRVLVAIDRALNPDSLAGWQTRTADTSDVPNNMGGEVALGAYEIAGGTIRLRLVERLKMLPGRDILVCEKLDETYCREKVEEHPFRATKGYETIVLGKEQYAREADQTGRKLRGEFKYNEYNFGTSRNGTLRLAEDGHFELKENWDGRSPICCMTYAGWREGSGQYEIRGHEIVFQGKIKTGGGGEVRSPGPASSGFGESTVTTMHQAFSDRGRDAKGRRRIQIGPRIYTEGDAPIKVQGVGQVP